jgi:ATP/maltotriose-dependent transcriptional regulator MalT/two-component SAPR family response regulator
MFNYEVYAMLKKLNIRIKYENSCKDFYLPIFPRLSRLSIPKKIMSTIPVSKTKIVLPRRRAGFLTRKRLVDLLFEALDKKLVLVSAPAGSGKTSLLIDLAHQSDLPCCWLALDKLDRDPQRFITYFIAAIAEQFQNFGRQSISMLNEMDSFDTDMEGLVVTLVNEIYEHIQEHFILVLDDLQFLEEVPHIQNFLNRFAQLVEENCHLIFSSRTLNSLPDLTLMVARGQVSGLSFSDLSFRADEIQALLAQNNNLRISDDEARNIMESTEGWITGLQFSGSHIFQDHQKVTIGSVGVGLFDYLGQQVFNRQPPDLQMFLLRTSLLDEFDVTLCQNVLAEFYPEPQNWRAYINAVIQNNLFALPLGMDGKWIRYHHLFRDFLQTRYKLMHPNEIAPLYARIGQAYEKLGEWEKAHHICRQLNDKTALAEMIERASLFMLQRAQHTFASWLDDLPPSMLRTRPGLLSIRGTIIYMKGDLAEGLELLDRAEQAFRVEKNASGLPLTLARRATAYRFLGDYSASIRDADEVIELTEDSDDLQLLYAEALRMKGLALYRIGNVRQAVIFLERSLNINVRLNDAPHIPILLMEVGMAYREAGNYQQASAAYEQALKIWRQDGNLFWQANLLNNMGVMYHGQGEYEKAAQAFEEGLLCAQRSNYARIEALISISLGDLYVDVEGFESAHQNYQHAAAIIQNMDDRFLIHALGLSQASLALLKRDFESAQRLIETVNDSIRTGDAHFENGLLDLFYGRLFLWMNESARALSSLQKAEQSFLEDERELESAITRVWLSAVHLQNGEMTASIEKIRSVISAKIPNPVLIAVHQALPWLGELQKDRDLVRTAGSLFTQAVRLSGELPSIRRHLRRQTHVTQVPVPHISIQTFGRTQVSMGSKVLTLSDWQTQSVRDLFFYFLINTKPSTKEQIGVILWPDQYDESKLKLRFKNEIYRLRRAVGQDLIRFEDVYYFFNRNLDYEYDVEAFEAYVARAKSAQSQREQIELYQKAVDLIHGQYLNDVYMDWVLPERERLSQMILSSFESLADLYVRQAQPEQALAACQSAIQYDPGFEPAYRISMLAYKRLNDKPSIIRVYETCQEACMKQFDLPPSKETEDLYHQLITNSP